MLGGRTVIKNLDFLFKKQKELRVKLYSENSDNFYNRDCIVPIDWNKAKISNYLEHSLNVTSNRMKLGEFEEVIILKESIDKFCPSEALFKSTINPIDYYWCDVKEFIIEIQNKLQQFSFILVTGYEINEIEVKNVIIDFFPNDQIKVDYYRDCWLSKNIDLSLAE